MAFLRQGGVKQKKMTQAAIDKEGENTMKKGIVLILAALICLSGLTGCGRSTVSIDLSDYLNVLYRGADGKGTARGDFDYSEFEKAVMAGSRSDEFNLSGLVQFESAMVITVSPESGLKNGDKVTVTASYDKNAAKAAGIKISGNSRDFTVEGLGSGSTGEGAQQKGSIELDAFDPAYWNTENGIVITYSDVSPYGHLEVLNNLPAENPLSKVSYKFSESQNLHEGDKVTVTAYFGSNNKAKDVAQYYFKEITTTYTVGVVDHYLTDISELDSATIASVKQRVQDLSADGTSGYLQFQNGSETKGFFNGETVSVNSCRAGNTAYAFRTANGLIEAVAIPCYLNVTVQEPDWMEKAQSYEYDLVFLCTVKDFIVHADGSVTTGEAALCLKGTSDMESRMMDDLKTWFLSTTVESVGFIG